MTITDEAKDIAIAEVCARDGQPLGHHVQVALAAVLAERDAALAALALIKAGLVDRLCAMWQADAEAMDDIASEEHDEETRLALECRERSKTLRDCQCDLRREWALLHATPAPGAAAGAVQIGFDTGCAET